MYLSKYAKADAQTKKGKKGGSRQFFFFIKLSDIKATIITDIFLKTWSW